MSDADLRGLERRFRETGSVEDEAAWLLERVRSGGLEESRLELATFLGHRAATLALSGEPRVLKPGSWEISQLLCTSEPSWGLSRWGEECVLRLVPAIAHGLLSYFDLDVDAPALIQAEAALASGERGPSVVGRETLIAFMIEATDDHSRWLSFLQRDAHSLGVTVLTVLARAYQVQRDWARSEYPPDDVDVADYVEGQLDVVSSEILSPLFEFGGEEVGGRTPEGVRSAVVESVRSELVPWALGYGDPVHDRVEARLRGEGAGG